MMKAILKTPDSKILQILLCHSRHWTLLQNDMSRHITIGNKSLYEKETALGPYYAYINFFSCTTRTPEQY